MLITLTDTTRPRLVPSVRPELVPAPPPWHDQGVLASNGPDDRYRAGTADPRQGRPPGGGPGPSAAPGGRGRAPGRGPGNGPKGAGPAGSGKAAGKRGKERGPGPDRRSGRRPGGPPEPVVPIRRGLSISLAGFALLLAFGLVIGSQATQIGFTVVLFGVQVFFVLAWTVASRPPSLAVTAIVGVLTAAASCIAVNIPIEASLVPVGYVIAGAFGATVIAQLAVRGGRAGVTESLGVTTMVVVGVTALSSFAVLSRQPLGDQVMLAGLAAVGVGIATARICDVISPTPRITPQVPRGSTGIIAGAMAGTAAGAIAGLLVDGMSTFEGAVAGMVAVLVAVVVDLGTGYAEAGRKLEGDAPFMWLARHLQGPVGAFAFAAPVLYVVGVILR